MGVIVFLHCLLDNSRAVALTFNLLAIQIRLFHTVFSYRDGVPKDAVNFEVKDGVTIILKHGLVIVNPWKPSLVTDSEISPLRRY